MVIQIGIAARGHGGGGAFRRNIVRGRQEVGIHVYKIQKLLTCYLQVLRVIFYVYLCNAVRAGVYACSPTIDTYHEIAVVSFMHMPNTPDLGELLVELRIEPFIFRQAGRS